MTDKLLVGDRVVAIRNHNRPHTSNGYAFKAGERGTVTAAGWPLWVKFDGAEKATTVAQKTSNGPGVRRLTRDEIDSMDLKPGDAVIAIRPMLGTSLGWSFKPGDRGIVESLPNEESAMVLFEGQPKATFVSQSSLQQGPGVRKLTEAEIFGSTTIPELVKVEPDESEGEDAAATELTVQGWIAALRDERQAFRDNRCGVHAAKSESYEYDTARVAVVVVELSDNGFGTTSHKILLCAECAGHATAAIFRGDMDEPKLLRWLS